MDLRSIVLAGLVSLGAMATGTGCATLGLAFPAAKTGPAAATSEPAAAQPQPHGDTSATLSAVEAFLERTREYQAAAPPAVPPAGEQQDPEIESRARLASTVRPEGTAIPPTGHDPVANRREVWIDEQRTPPRGWAETEVPELPVLQSLTIRADAAGSQEPPTPQRSTAANEPLDMHRTQTPALIDEVLDQLRAQSAESDDALLHWQHRMTEVAFGRASEPPVESSRLPQETEALLAGFVETAKAVRALVYDPSLSGDSVLEWLDHLRETLLSRTGISVSRVALCRKVVTFGVYEELDDTDFLSGRTLRAIVYTQINRFQSELTDARQFRTALATRLEVFSADGQSVWMHEEPDIEDLSRARRTDFFIAQRITLPPTLPADEYVLKVLVEDRLSGKMDETAHRFAIRAAHSVARGG
jgi:hypothetical protein